MPRLWVPDKTIKRTKPPLGAQVNWGHPLAKGLRVGWLFSEGATKLFDITRGGNDGTSYTTGGIASTTSPFGQSKDFTGSTNYYNFPYNANAQCPDSFSIVMWVKLKTTIAEDSGLIHAYESGSNIRNYHIFTRADALRFYVSDALTYTYVLLSITYDDKWHQIVAVRNTTTDLLTLYGDTVPGNNGQDETTTTIVPTTGVVANIGTESANTDFVFDSAIDHIFIYGRALTRGEIIQLYAEPFCMLKMPKRARALKAAAAGGSVVPVLAGHQFRLRRA
jgi:hypothetical protein